MGKKASTLLKEIIKDNQNTTDEYLSKEKAPAYGFLTENKKGVTQFIWFDHLHVIINDPVMINELGGGWLIKNKLQHSPVSYLIKYEDNHLYIVGERENFWEINAAEKFLLADKKNLKETKGLKEKIEDSSLLITKNRLEYIKKVFPQTNIFVEKDRESSHLYFFEDDLKAVLAPVRF